MGRSSQGRTPNPSQGQTGQHGDFMLWNATENGRVVTGTGPGLSQERVPVCPRDSSCLPKRRPAQNVYVYWFFFARKRAHRTTRAWQYGCLRPPRAVLVGKKSASWVMSTEEKAKGHGKGVSKERGELPNLLRKNMDSLKVSRCVLEAFPSS